MALIVPYDGTDLANAALRRAAQFDTVLGEGVVTVAVVPKNNDDYARERGWIGEGDPFDRESILGYLRDAVADVAPGAEFHHVFVDRYAPEGTIARRLREFARTHDASIVFVGSDNAGRIARSITVGQTAAAGSEYDTMIVRTIGPTPVENLRDADPPVDGSE